MKRFIESHLARKAAEATARASATGVASVPAASTANSAGASTNAAEISRTLDPLLNRLTEEERLTIAEENVAIRLQRLCDMYQESHIPEGLQPWQWRVQARTDDTLSLVRLAADGAEAVYKHPDRAVVDGVTLSEEDYTEICSIGASQLGGFKATAIRVHKSSGTLVVAIRGTKKTSPVDWITNTNGAPEDATEFLPGVPGVKAHGGFLYAAKTMCDPIISAIKSCETELSRILLTGHSAGGAVAALLFIRVQLTAAFDTPTHCITFGAPPVVAPRGIEQSLMMSKPGDRRPSTGEFLALAAHGDIVVRADRPYVRKILEVYSTTTALSPAPRIQFEAPELYNAGELILLFDSNPDGDEDRVQAVEAESAIETFLWGNVKAHAMTWYCDLIAKLPHEST